MITCSRHSDIEKETRKQEKMAPLVISPPLSFHYSGGSRRGGPGGPKKGPKKVFLETAPPAYLRVWITPPPYLKVWIRQCTITLKLS